MDSSLQPVSQYLSSIGATVFKAARYKEMYNKFLGPLAKPVVLKYNDGTKFTSYRCTAFVTSYRETDLVQGGSIEIGDLKVIINKEDLPTGLRDMERKDRIEIEGRSYSVIHWDNETRSMGSEIVAIEVRVRG